MLHCTKTNKRPQESSKSRTSAGNMWRVKSCTCSRVTMQTVDFQMDTVIADEKQGHPWAEGFRG